MCKTKKSGAFVRELRAPRPLDAHDSSLIQGYLDTAEPVDIVTARLTAALERSENEHANLLTQREAQSDAVDKQRARVKRLTNGCLEAKRACRRAEQEQGKQKQDLKSLASSDALAAATWSRVTDGEATSSSEQVFARVDALPQCGSPAREVRLPSRTYALCAPLACLELCLACVADNTQPKSTASLALRRAQAARGQDCCGAG